jgi:imidazolonepropionase-like amidohydrolase
MHLRVTLRVPGGEAVTYDTREGAWAEPWGDPDEVIAPGLWALPGLVDGHAHLARATMDLRPGDLEGAGTRAAMALRAGVGLILDKGWRDLTVVHLIDEVPASERPEIEAAGVVLAVDDGFWEGFARHVAPGDVGEAAAVAAKEGAGWVKLIGDWPRKGLGPVTNFDEAALGEAVAAASEHGARVAVHTMAREVPSMAVRAGVDSIEHGLFLSDHDLELLGARGGCWVPTVVQMEATISQLGERSSGGRLLIEGLENVRARLGAAVDCGVHVLTGTDLVIGSHEVAREAVRLWEMGLAAEAVIAAVSWSGFRATGRPWAFDVGDPANAVLFSENPISNPRALTDPAVVIRVGRVVS